MGRKIRGSRENKRGREGEGGDKTEHKRAKHRDQSPTRSHEVVHCEAQVEVPFVPLGDRKRQAQRAARAASWAANTQEESTGVEATARQGALVSDPRQVATEELGDADVAAGIGSASAHSRVVSRSQTPRTFWEKVDRYLDGIPPTSEEDEISDLDPPTL